MRMLFLLFYDYICVYFECVYIIYDNVYVYILHMYVCKVVIYVVIEMQVHTKEKLILFV